MAYYEDLSPYAYSDDADEPGRAGEGEGFGAPLLNVGWLAAGHEFPLGDVPEGFVDALLRLAENTVNVYRGMHFCDFCPTFREARKNVRFRDAFIGSGAKSMCEAAKAMSTPPRRWSWLSTVLRPAPVKDDE
jgi:hypothetical protein